MTTEHYDVLVVGAGHAGAQAAAALRQRKFVGKIGLVGDELEPPYERPPLSKEYLSSQKPFERMLIRPLSFWTDRQVDLLPGRRIVAIDPSAHRVEVAGGVHMSYGKLIWATGGTPRRLVCSGHDLAGVHTVRSRADVDRMIAELSTTERVVVIGAGYIGLEAASVLTKLGKHVTVLEALPRVLSRVAGAALSQFFESEHRAHGVDLRFGVTVDCIDETNGRATGVRLADGTHLSAEMVIVGVGILPAVEPLLAAGATGGNGVTVDQFCRTSLPDIFAVGDCASHPNPFFGGASLRLESVQNANDQANTVAKFLTGVEEPYSAVPWFWSNQYDLLLQTVGLSAGHDETVLRGDTATRSFSLIYLKEGRVVALDCVNATKDYVQGRALVVAGTRAEPAKLANVDVSLKEILACSAPSSVGLPPV